MALIPQDELAILKSASEVKSIADSAELEAQKMAVAKLINSAANTGIYTAIWNHEMSDELKEVLEGMSYVVTRKPMKFCADPKFQYLISWKQLGGESNSESSSTEEPEPEPVPADDIEPEPIDNAG